MKYGKVKFKYTLIELITDKEIEKLNSLFGTKYTRKQIKKIVKNAKKPFKFWKKLMETPPGFKDK